MELFRRYEKGRLWVIVGLTSLLAACGGGANPAASSPGIPKPPITWMISTGALDDLQQIGQQSLASQFFNQPQNWVVGSAFPSWAGNWTARLVISEPSLPGISGALAKGLPSSIKGVLYDLEDWSLSPSSEQQNPVGSTEAAQGLVHPFGLELIATPAVDLVNVLSPGSVNHYASYLALDIPAVAQYADVFEIQAQGLEADEAGYASFVTAAAQEARKANPAVIVLAGLSTNPNGQQVTSRELYADVEATRNVVNGYWLNIPSGGSYCPKCGAPQPEVAVGLLQLLQESGP